MTKMTREEAFKRLSQIETQSYELMHEGVKIAEEYGLGFDIPFNTYASEKFYEELQEARDTVEEIGLDEYMAKGGLFDPDEFWQVEHPHGWQISNC